MAKCDILKYPLSCSMESIKGCFVADSAFPRETTSIKMMSILIPFMLIKQIEAECLVDNANSRNGEQSSRPCHYPLIKKKKENKITQMATEAEKFCFRHSFPPS